MSKSEMIVHADGSVTIQAADPNPPTNALRERAIAEAKAAIKRGVMAKYGDLPIVSIEVSDEDAQRYIDGATIEELIA